MTAVEFLLRELGNKFPKEVINPAIGKNEPHQNLTVYKTIGNKLDTILK
jgi:hypothetical protein